MTRGKVVRCSKIGKAPLPVKRATFTADLAQAQHTRVQSRCTLRDDSKGKRKRIVVDTCAGIFRKTVRKTVRKAGP